MKRLLILGAETAGTMMASRLGRELSAKEWQITIVEQEQADDARLLRAGGQSSYRRKILGGIGRSSNHLHLGRTSH